MGLILTKAWIFQLAPLYKDGFVSNTSSKSLCRFLNLSDIIVVKHASGSMVTSVEYDVLLSEQSHVRVEQTSGSSVGETEVI